ncbi:MAG: DUF2868 domain-containing protein [Gammaproteobacteria bacterium]|nr:DUF2868 domain-containing protein [Gammaproteobacteria bacterium]
MTDFLSPLHTLWLCETVRLREQHTGLLEDSEACRKARSTPGTLAQRLQVRGMFLAERDGLVSALQHWLQGAKLALWVLILSALITGVALAKTALSGAPQAINIFWALAGLLGLNLLSLLAWCFSLIFSRHSSSPLSQAWLWLSSKLARDAKAAHLAPALLVLLQRQQLLRWGVGRILHGWWLLTLSTALLTLIALLATRRYGFIWESTIVASEAFISLVSSLGQPATWLGFAMPDSELIRHSGLQASSAEQARHIWASWLLGMLLVYGIVPRVIASLFCEWRWRRGVARLQLNAEDPVWHIFHQRVQPSSERLGVVDAAPAALPSTSAGSQQAGHNSVLVAIELDDSISWPPKLPAQVLNAGIIDSREQRTKVLEQLTAAPPARLLIACNPQRSVDRGVLHLIAELSRTATQTRIWLLTTSEIDERVQHWQEQLDGLQLTYSRTAPWTWLEHGND